MAKFDLFVSHSAKDKEFVRRLRTDLEIYGCRVWVDETYLSVGSALSTGLEQAIRESRFVAVVYSRDAMISPWVEHERLYAVANGIPVIPIVLDRGSLNSEVSSQVYADFTDLDDQHSYHRALHDVLSLLGTGASSSGVLHVYTDGLAPGWLNSSWDARCIERYTIGDGPVPVCFRASLYPFGGIAFVFRSGINTAPFSRFRFSLHGGGIGGQAMKVFLNDRIGDGMRNQMPLAPLPANQWESFDISLAELDAVNTIIFKVNWSHATGDISGPVDVANVSFAG